MERLQTDLIGRATDADPDPLAQCNLEDTINNWLDDAQIADSWPVAPMLASAGMNPGELARIREQVGDDLLSDTLNWLESALAIAGCRTRSSAVRPASPNWSRRSKPIPAWISRPSKT